MALGAPCAHAAQALRRSGGLGGRAPHSFHCFRCLWRLRCFELSTSFSCACSGFEPLFVLTAQAVVCVCGIGACSMLGPRSSACCVLVFANSCSWHVHVSWHFMFHGISCFGPVIRSVSLLILVFGAFFFHGSFMVRTIVCLQKHFNN